MFWQKKSKEPANRSDYLTFYVEGDDLQVEFAFKDIESFTRICDSILNGKVRNSCMKVIESKIRDGGLGPEADYFVQSVNKTIKPSEYSI